MNYRAQKGSLCRSIFHFISPIDRDRKSGYGDFKNVHKKHGIKLTESKMEPVLLVQTMVPGGGWEESKQGQGFGRNECGNMEGKMPIRIHSAGHV